MSLPKLVIKLWNGALRRATKIDDGVAGLILTGAAVEGKFDLNKVYVFSSIRDLTTYGITAENNPLVFKEVTQFFTKRGDGGELYLLVVAPATTLVQMCANVDGSPIRKLIAYARGRIKLVGLNRLPAAGYEAQTDETGIDKDAVLAGELLQAISDNYRGKIMPFRALLPGLMWDGSTEKLYKPRESTYNAVQYVMASDQTIGEHHTAAIGQALGVYSAIAVHYSLGRVKNGIITLDGRLTNGKTPEECEALLDALHDAGYVIYRTFTGRNGYYFNDDPMAAPLSDDYSNMYLGRVIDKAIVLAYGAYIDEILDSVEVDENGKLSAPVCVYYEGLMETAVKAGMNNEISSFDVFVDPDQDLLTTSTLVATCKIVPKGVTRDIIVNLGFENPALKS